MPVGSVHPSLSPLIGGSPSSAPGAVRAQSMPVPDSPLAARLSAVNQAHGSTHQLSFQGALHALSTDAFAEIDPSDPTSAPQFGDGVDPMEASELGDALADLDPTGRAASAPAPAFSVADALDFRVNHYQAAQTLADEWIHRVGVAMEHTRDPATLRRLQGVLDGLQQFKSDLHTAEQGDRERAHRLLEDERLAQTAAERFRLAKQLSGGTVKKPFSAKTWYSFKLFDGIRARCQQALIRRTGAQGGAFQPPGGPLHLRTALATHLSGVLTAGGLTDCGANALQKSMVLHAARHAERAMSWSTIENSIELSGSNAQPLTFANAQYPARVFSPALATAYGPGRKGVSCMNSAEPEHVVNLWKTTFRAPGEPGLAFSALRHGIHDAYALKKDPVARAKAADARVREFVIAAAQTEPKRLIPAGTTPSGLPVFEVPVVSVSLVSPARFGNEAAMWQHQREAYARANGQPVSAMIDTGDGQGPREVMLRPNVVAFNTPVNTFALESGGLMRAALGGWAQSDAANGPALDALIGPPGAEPGGLAGRRLLGLRAERDRLMEGPALSAEQQSRVAVLDGQIARAGVLIGQIRAIVAAPTDSDVSHHRAGHDPYKLPVRLAALANELELPVAFNCKSGKDRTGQLDVEIKAFYASIALNGGTVPEPGREPDAQDRANRARLFNEAGSFEIQKHNTSVPGSKINLDGLKSQLKRAMREALPEGTSRQASRQVIKEHIKGLSGWVGS
ncbi:MAG: hypothetical protein RL322_2703 [Pseudomonadota bacterium]